MSCRNIDLTNQIIIITVAQIIIMIMTIFIIIVIAMTFDGSNINVFCVCPSAMSDVQGREAVHRLYKPSASSDLSLSWLVPG